METTQFIQYLLNNAQLNSNRVLELTQSFTNNDINELMRIMSYLTGFSEMTKVSEHSQKRKEKEATLVSYDFFRNQVTFKYLKERKFKVTEEWVANNDNQIFSSFYDIPIDVRNAHNGTIEITVFHWAQEDCDLSSWQ